MTTISPRSPFEQTIIAFHFEIRVYLVAFLLYKLVPALKPFFTLPLLVATYIVCNTDDPACTKDAVTWVLYALVAFGVDVAYQLACLAMAWKEIYCGSS